MSYNWKKDFRYSNKVGGIQRPGRKSTGRQQGEGSLKSLQSSRVITNHIEIARPLPISWFDRSMERPRSGSS